MRTFEYASQFDSVAMNVYIYLAINQATQARLNGMISFRDYIWFVKHIKGGCEVSS